MGLAKKGGERSGIRSLLHFCLGYRDSQSLFFFLVGRNSAGMAVLRRGNRSSLNQNRLECFYR